MSDQSTFPFTNYPHQGRKLLGWVSGNNGRYGYGLKFQQLTRQDHCAYCGISLVGTYENWLTMALDHVLPDRVCKSLGLPEEWIQDYSNRALCCTACNTFGNRYKLKTVNIPRTLEEFYDLRDQVFAERKVLILERHRKERIFFETQPWSQVSKGTSVP